MQATKNYLQVIFEQARSIFQGVRSIKPLSMM